MLATLPYFPGHSITSQAFLFLRHYTLLAQAKLEDVAGVTFNSCLLNLYRNGADHMGWHSDNEKLYGDDPVIGKLSDGVCPACQTICIVPTHGIACADLHGFQCQTRLCFVNFAFVFVCVQADSSPEISHIAIWLTVTISAPTIWLFTAQPFSTAANFPD